MQDSCVVLISLNYLKKSYDLEHFLSEYVTNKVDDIKWKDDMSSSKESHRKSIKQKPRPDGGGGGVSSMSLANGRTLPRGTYFLGAGL